MEKSESINEIGGALLAFHKEVSNIAKTSENPFFKSKYADLSSILDAIKEPLQKSGLSFVQFPTGEYGLTTLLIHGESGEWIKGEYSLKPAQETPQGRGSAITYQRRYALCSILGLNTEDDDGEAATRPIKTVVPAKKTPETKAQEDRGEREIRFD